MARPRIWCREHNFKAKNPQGLTLHELRVDQGKNWSTKKSRNRGRTRMKRAA